MRVTIPETGGYVIAHTKHNNNFPHEFSMAEAFAKNGKKVKLLSESAPKGVKTPDAEIIGEGVWDFKNINPNVLPKNISKNIHDYVLNAKNQADNIAFNLVDNPNVTLEMVNQGVSDAVQTAKNAQLSSIADKVSVVNKDGTTKIINISEFSKTNGTRF